MKLVTILIFLFISGIVIADEKESHPFIYGYLAGDYLLIGKKLDSDKTYQGEVKIENKETHLEITRKIDGKETKAIGKIEHAVMADSTNVLRIIFNEDGADYEATYLWASDLDNYARIIGYLYRPKVKTEKPGLEALFIHYNKR